MTCDENSVIYTDAFSSADHLRGNKRTYASVKEAVVLAGRFSIFEATNTRKDVALFGSLHHDPEVKVYDMQYPWIGVQRKQAEEEERG